MRLIDADEFKEYVSEGYEQNKDLLQTDEYRNFAGAVTQGMLKDIDEQPTAYDIDKVVKQLEKVSFIDVDEEYADNGQNMLFLHDATEIVKKGGSYEQL